LLSLGTELAYRSPLFISGGSMAHTQGDWTVSKASADDAYHIALAGEDSQIPHRRKLIARVYQKYKENPDPNASLNLADDETTMANARLMAAAPDLLVALRRFVRRGCSVSTPIGDDHDEEGCSYCGALRAIEKAEKGEPILGAIWTGLTGRL